MSFTGVRVSVVVAEFVPLMMVMSWLSEGVIWILLVMSKAPRRNSHLKGDICSDRGTYYIYREGYSRSRIVFVNSIRFY